MEYSYENRANSSTEMNNFEIYVKHVRGGSKMFSFNLPMDISVKNFINNEIVVSELRDYFNIEEFELVPMQMKDLSGKVHLNIYGEDGLTWTNDFIEDENNLMINEVNLGDTFYIRPTNPDVLLCEAETCVVCYEKKYTNVPRYPCGHSLCVGCSDSWKMSYGYLENYSLLSTCPMCRTAERCTSFHYTP